MHHRYSGSEIRTTRDGFTVLELMVSITIFTIGFLGAYLLIDRANEISIRSRDEIIGANIMREQVELLKNLRDTNWIQYRKWNAIALAKEPTETENAFGSGFYILRNRFDPSRPLAIKRLSDFPWNKEAILDAVRTGNPRIALCLDSHDRYTECTDGTRKTWFASFFRVEPLTTIDSTDTKIPVDEAYRVTTYFVSTDKWYREYRMNTVITDWKK